ncbi:hypothetical protein CBR_g53828 [Chara braunii]|uniref:DUF659 domain-containing protein n=1 Tax=Chara braunii TaxID=69332 RepID=A0A388K744_CHABU|nr:hypothetical protein CBR_g53828 [Chara braunii]|eukprot:GBG65856.1 hypothetical protein CBR_g53828 [Chara braunii]
MSHRDKTGISSAEIWEDVIRNDIGIKNVNAICTDNAEVMKTAAHTLQTHPYPAMRVLPWIPCAAHCLNLLLRDIVAQPFARQTMRDAHKIVKFMRNKQNTLALHKIMKKALVLKRPVKTRFGTSYVMLERLYDQREVLDTLVSSERWATVRWARDARERMPHVRTLCRNDGFWSGVKRVMDVMGLVYGFLKDVDRDGSSPTDLWDLEAILRGRLRSLELSDIDRDAVTDIVRDRYVDIWADQVEDEEVALDVDDVIPAHVPKEEYEAIERSNRRKEGRNRAGNDKAPTVDSEDEEEDIFDDLVWMHQGIRKEAEARRGAGTNLPEDQHDLLDEDDGFWSGVKRVMDVMGPVYGFLRDVDRDGSSPTDLWDLEAILRGRLRSPELSDIDRDAVMDIVRDRCAMMRQPAHAGAYLLDPRRRDISLLENRSRPVVQSALEHFARVVGGWDSDAMPSMWEALWTFHSDDPQYWPQDGQHWWDSFATADANKMHPSMWWGLHGGQQPVLQGIAQAVMGTWSTASPCERNWATHDFVHTKLRNRLTARNVEKLVFIHWNLQLLSESKRSQSRYVDIWADQVKDEEVALDVDNVIPADVPEEEHKAIERSNRRNEGRNRAGKGKAPTVDSEDEEEDIFYDLVWMHQGIRKEAEAKRGAGMTLPEDQHDLLDEWGGQDPHDDFDAYVGAADAAGSSRLKRSDFTKTTMPKGGRKTRPPRRPLEASGGHERHGSHRKEHTPVHDDGNIELFLDEFRGYAERIGWTVAERIERLRGVGRFEEPIVRICREART